jgi:hypothetical protein
MIKFRTQAEVDESKRLKAKPPETVVAASSEEGAPSAKSKPADARVAPNPKRQKASKASDR